MNPRQLFYVLATAILCGLALPSSAQPPPPNDDYENRIQLTGDNFTFTGTTVSATFQTNEILPQLYNYAPPQSVWWTWTAPATAQVSIDLVNCSDEKIFQSLGYIALWQNVNWANRTGENHYGMLMNNVGRRHFEFPAVAGMNYDIQVFGLGYGTFTLRITQSNAPIILVQPQDRLVMTGGSTFLGVVVGSLSPVTYQWRFNGTNIANQTWPILSLDNVNSSMAGGYTVTVDDGVAAVESKPGRIAVASDNRRPILSSLTATSDSFTFQISASPLTSYRIESSTNLVDWQPEKTFRWAATYEAWSAVVYNRDEDTTFSMSPNAPQKFLRATRYSPEFDSTTTPPGTPAISEVCINNLRKIRFAKELWGIGKLSRTGDPVDDWASGLTIDWVPTSSELLRYMAPVGCPYYTTNPSSDPDWSFQVCYTVDRLDRTPVCNIGSPAHSLEEPPDTQ